MREIKFRAWDKKNKLMLYGDSDLLLDLNGVIAGFSDDDGGKSGLHEHAYKVDVELMQYTGFKDKNGKEIYEGDILQRDAIFIGSQGDDIDNPYSLKPFVIKWSQNYKPGWDIWGAPYQIIGNIYENPELLKA